MNKTRKIKNKRVNGYRNYIQHTGNTIRQTDMIKNPVTYKVKEITPIFIVLMKF